jgi:PAS domain S-box-containing protein
MKSISVQLGTAENQLRAPRAEDRNVAFDSPMLVTGLVVFVGYYLGAKLGFALTFRPHPVSVLWPPNSILAAALLLTPLRIWWLVLLAAFPAHLAAELQSQVPPTMILCWFISNSCEAVIGAGLTRYLIGGPVKLNCLRSVGFFCLGVVFIAPFLSSFLDAGFVRWNVWGQSAYWEIWRVRFTSNVLAALTVAPLIVTWATSGIPSLRTARRSRYLEVGLLLLGLLSVSFAVLYRLGSGTDPTLLYLPLPFLLWAAVQFGSCGASTALWIVTFSAIWGATHGHGPFAGGSPEQNALAVQLFLIVLSTPLIFLAAVVEERANVEQRFAKVFRSSPDAMLVIRRKDSCIMDVNERWQTIFGYRREEAISHRISDPHPNSGTSDLEKLIAGTSEGKPLHDLELSLRTKTGDVRDTVLSADTVDIAGEPCFVVIIRDITHRKRGEAALRESEERMSLAAEVSHLGVWDWDETTGKLLWDGATREIFDVPLEGEVTLDTFYRAVYPHDLERVKQVWRQAVESGLPYQIEFRVRRSNGAIGWIHARGRGYYDDKGKPLRMIGVVFDITDRKQAEEEAHTRRDQIDLLTRVSLLGEMTTYLAHELNQPLSAIVTNANVGTRFIDNGDVDLGTIREILVDVVADGYRANEIIRAVRNTMKKGGAIRQQIDLNETVTKVAHLVQPDATVHSCELRMSLAKYLPPIDGDPVQIQQVLVNLISNAFDAMHKTPPKRRVVEIQTEQDGDGSICVSVQDRGDGIPDAVRERLFEQFFTTKEEGLGMGLAIVSSIIEAHGGKINAENVDGGGARFYFILPQSQNSSQ